MASIVDTCPLLPYESKASKRKSLFAGLGHSFNTKKKQTGIEFKLSVGTSPLERSWTKAAKPISASPNKALRVFFTYPQSRRLAVSARKISKPWHVKSLEVALYVGRKLYALPVKELAARLHIKQENINDDVGMLLQKKHVKIRVLDSVVQHFDKIYARVKKVGTPFVGPAVLMKILRLFHRHASKCRQQGVHIAFDEKQRNRYGLGQKLLECYVRIDEKGRCNITRVVGGNTKLLAKGSFGTVHVVEQLDCMCLMAFKRAYPMDQQLVAFEIKNLYALHLKKAPVYGLQPMPYVAFSQPDSGYVCRLFSCDLSHLIRGKNVLTDTQKAILMDDLLRGVAYAIECRVYHTDIKPENVLISRHEEKRGLYYHGYIADWGGRLQFQDLKRGVLGREEEMFVSSMAYVYKEEREMLTFIYRISPEDIEKALVQYMLLQLGLVLADIARDGQPIVEYSQGWVSRVLPNAREYLLKAMVSSEAAELILNLIQESRKKRPSIEEVKKKCLDSAFHWFFSPFDKSMESEP